MADKYQFKQTKQGVVLKGTMTFVSAKKRNSYKTFKMNAMCKILKIRNRFNK